MSKFIEVDKLLVEIEKWRDKAKEKYNESTYSMGRCDALAEFRNHIVSLQQEPRFPQYNNIVEKVFGAGNIEGFEYREAEMLVALAKEELLKSLQ